MLELLRRIQFLFRRESFERELEEEMRHHLALKAENAQNPGAAAHPFGNAGSIKEKSRAMWTFPLFEQLTQDIRYALRAMAANPLFTATAALSLALGIGANTAIYSFMDAILMRALPVPHPEQLAVFKWSAKGRPGVISSLNGSNSRNKQGVSTSPNFPFASWDVFAAGREIASSVFGYAYSQSFNLNIDGHAEAVNGVPVSGNFFSGLEIVPAAGRLIGAEDDRSGAPLTAVLSHAYWQRRFNADPAVLGKSVLINNLPATIVGVSASEFFGLDPAVHPEFFFALHNIPIFSPNSAADQNRRFFDSHMYWLEMTARLRPGVSLAQAQAVFSTQFRRFAESTVRSEKDRAIFPNLWLDAGSSGLNSLRQQYSDPLHILMAMVGLILAIACANMANLLLARSSARRREMAVRLSLGAGRWRIVRQLLTESVLLSLIGGALGLILAYWGIQFITWLIANGRDNFTLHAGLDWSVLGFTFALSLVAGLLFGLAPALQSTGFDLTPALKESKAGASHVRRSVWRPGLGGALIVSQIALALLLVLGAGLFVKNLVNLNSVDLGFNRGNILLFSLNVRDAGYKDETAARFFDGVHDRVSQLPGVRAVGLSNFPLVAQYVNDSGVHVSGAVPGAPTSANLLNVDADFLPALQIPILMGRGLEKRDIAARSAVVVNQKFVTAFLGGESPLGHHVTVEAGPRLEQVFEIVGVARDAHYNSIQEVVSPTVYLPYTQDRFLSRMFFNVRTAGDPLAMVNPIREIVRQADSNVLLTSINTQARQIEQTIGQQRTFADLGTCFAALAMLIACVGLYGAMAYTVARRTSEIGIRIALGARRGRILWMVQRQVLLLAAAGLGLGFYAARGLSHWIESYLFGMKPGDPIAIAAAVGILLGAALFAGFIPAWRASRIHPMTALRYE